VIPRQVRPHRLRVTLKRTGPRKVARQPAWQTEPDDSDPDAIQKNEDDYPEHDHARTGSGGGCARDAGW